MTPKRLIILIKNNLAWKFCGRIKKKIKMPRKTVFASNCEIKMHKIYPFFAKS